MQAITTQTTLKTDILGIIQGAKLAQTTRKQYTKAILNYLETGGDLGDADALGRYSAGLKSSSRAFLKAAIRLWGQHTAQQAKASATPDNVAAVAATLYRLDALNSAIALDAPKGQRAHTWLSQAEVKNLLGTANIRTLAGKRNRLILGLLVGAGLRREELAELTFDAITLQPVAGKIRTVLTIHGKGGKDRVVPLSDALAGALDQWAGITGGKGHIARRISKGGAMGERLSAVAIFEIVNRAGRAIGRPELAPHDLRRTYARIGYDAGVDIGQISTLLGHASIATTQKYLGLKVNLTTTIGDFVPW